MMHTRGEGGGEAAKRLIQHSNCYGAQGHKKEWMGDVPIYIQETEMKRSWAILCHCVITRVVRGQERGL